MLVRGTTQRSTPLYVAAGQDVITLVGERRVWSLQLTTGREERSVLELVVPRGVHVIDSGGVRWCGLGRRQLAAALLRWVFSRGRRSQLRDARQAHEDGHGRDANISGQSPGALPLVLHEREVRRLRGGSGTSTQHTDRRGRALFCVAVGVVEVRGTDVVVRAVPGRASGTVLLPRPHAFALTALLRLRPKVGSENAPV